MERHPINDSYDLYFIAYAHEILKKYMTLLNPREEKFLKQKQWKYLKSHQNLYPLRMSFHLQISSFILYCVHVYLYVSQQAQRAISGTFAHCHRLVANNA